MKRTAFSTDEIDRARRLLELSERASIKDIKAAYRNMCKRWHPDTVSDDSEGTERMKEVNGAYRLLMEFCENYPCSFLPSKVESFDPEKWWYQRFGEHIRQPVEEEDDH
jgi:hypothetical protein